MPVTKLPVPIGGIVYSEGNIASQTPLGANKSFLSNLYSVDRADGVLMAYAASDQAGTLYVIFTDSSGTYSLDNSILGGGQTTALTTVPPGSGLKSLQEATIRTNFESRYFYLYYVNSNTAQTFFELGWRNQSS